MAVPEQVNPEDELARQQERRMNGRPRFSGWLLEAFTRTAIEWTREHHPERLRGEEHGESFHN